MVGYEYNPNLPNIEISLICSNIPPQSQRERRRRCDWREIGKLMPSLVTMFSAPRMLRLEWKPTRLLKQMIALGADVEVAELRTSSHG